MTVALDSGLVRVAATVPMSATADAVANLLDRGPDGWEPVPAEPGWRRFAVDLRLRIGGEGTGFTTFRKAAYVDLGGRRPAPDGFAQEIGWRAASAAPLFPVFSGDLRIGHASMAVTGLYAPPGGAIGLVADRALLHIAATGTARWLLRELDRLAVDGTASPASHPPHGSTVA